MTLELIKMATALYHRKLLKPRTRIVIPLKSITSARLEWKSLTRSGNIGAIARDPTACMKVAALTHVKVANFQKVLQFSSTNSVSDPAPYCGLDNYTKGSCGSSLGWGTRTRLEEAEGLTKRWLPVPLSSITSVPGTIWTLSSCSSWRRV